MRKKAKFLTSAAKLEQCPAPELPEIAFIGRSNAGKSSLINALFGTKIAKVSSTPGKTTLLNFFEVKDDFRFVDTPGYGYAARSRREVKSWKSMLENYFSCRSNLVGAVLVMDIRRQWQEDEALLAVWLEQLEIPLTVILSKADKLNRRDKEKRLKYFKELQLKAKMFHTSVKDGNLLNRVSDFLTAELLTNVDQKTKIDTTLEMR